MTPDRPKKPGEPRASGERASPCAHPGDEIFFHKKGKPVSGKVVAAGRHGCIVDHEGSHHRVRWEYVAGHKKRAVQRYHVVDHGEDGMIVRDQNGKHRYVGVPPESREERLKLK